MAIYEFKCLDCESEAIRGYRIWLSEQNETTLTESDLTKEPSMHEIESSEAYTLYFDVMCNQSESSNSFECVHCQGTNTKKIPSVFSYTFGRTRLEKTAGTTSKRFELGKYMRSEREKRKRTADPTSRDAITNELWTGTEVQRGVIKGPNKK